jgi:succinate dehydrogenase / fumarate reductase, cytochrome b subunit
MPAEDNEKPADEPAREGESQRGLLHAKVGMYVLGAYLALHLLTNASALAGSAAWEGIVGAMERSAVRPGIDLVVFAALLFHAGYGITRLRNKDGAQRWGSPRAFLAQRVSAVVVLLFVLVHVWELRVQRLVFGMAPSSLRTVLEADLSSTRFGIPWMALLYVVGLFAVAFHFATGLIAGRRTTRTVGLVIGVLVVVVGGATVMAFATGTRLLPGRDADSAPCGSAVPASSPR